MVNKQLKHSSSLGCLECNKKAIQYNIRQYSTDLYVHQGIPIHWSHLNKRANNKKINKTLKS